MQPVIALVGRPNVGKSTLFNRLTDSRDALVANVPGLTRDRQYGNATLDGRSCTVIDTGGLGDSSQVSELMAEQVELAIDEADLVLLLVDARAGRTAADEEIMQRLRVLGAEVLLVINKIDGIAPETAEAEFLVFGVADHALVSASHGRGIAGLATAVAAHLATSRPVTDTAPLPYVAGRVRLAVIGRPNVGKSTLINRWLGETRQVVFDAPGTTRDSIEIPLQHAVGNFLLVDTAGVRRKGRVDGVVEKFSVVKALQAMREADVAVLMIDAQEGLVDQDLHLFEFAADVGTGLVLAVNKWDGLGADTRASVKVGLDRRLTFAPWVPLRFISALHGTGVPDVLRDVLRVHRCADFDVQTPVLTRILNDAVRAHPPPSVSGRRIKLRYAHKTGGHPPTVMIHGNQTNAVPASYTRFLENRFRKALKLIGTPIKIVYRTGENPYQGKRNELTARQQLSRKRMVRHHKRRKR
jgi:GTP-binding protein